MPEFRIDLEEVPEKLPKAPIVEAVIHWRARPAKEVEPTELLTQLKEKLPDYPHSQGQHEVGLEAKVGPHESAIQQRHVWHGFRFESVDRLQVAQFTRNGFVFSRLKPYEDWEQFSTEGERLWRIYCELTEPAEVSRLGVRFINQITPIKPDSLDDLLELPPRSPEKLALPIAKFTHQDTFDIPGYPYKLNVIQTIQPANPPETSADSLILDLDVYTAGAVQHDDLDEKLLHMHWIKNKAFFSFLTTTAIARFRD